MIAVFRRELGSYFKSIMGYLFTAFVLLFAGIYTMAYNLSGYYANFEYAISAVTFIYLIAMPILTMRSVAEEKRSKTDQLLYSLPISLYTGDELNVTVLIGAKDEDGNYYARLPESRLVYSVTTSEVNTLLTASLDDLRVTELMPLDYERVQQAEITAGGSTFAFSGVPAEENTEETETAKETAAPGQDLWDLIQALTAAGYTDEAAQGDALLTVSVMNVNGVTETLSFHAYDVDSYLVGTANGQSALTDAAAVDKIIRTLRQLV